MKGTTITHATAAACVVALAITANSASAAPVFNAQYVGFVESSLDWSSDLGADVINTSATAVASGAPLTQSASAVRDGRLIQTQITQLAPSVLGGDYWAASWEGSIDVPRGGFYGLSGTSRASGHWSFAIPGQTAAQNNATVFYYASLWEVVGPADIHPAFSTQFLPSPSLSGSQIGSFTLNDFTSVGLAGFPMRPTFYAATNSLDQNGPGRVEFSYRIAFSTTPIDTSVFRPAPTVPEPGTSALAGLGVASALWSAHRRKTRS